LTDGHFRPRRYDPNGEGRNLDEIELAGPGPDDPDYRGCHQYTLTFDPRGMPTVLVYAGLWGKERDAWMQMDDFLRAAGAYLTPGGRRGGTSAM
jgi:hypothetical protein